MLVTGNATIDCSILPGRILAGELSMQKSRDWLYILISLLLLALSVAGLMRQIGVAELPPDFPWETVEWPIKAAGITVTNAADLVFLAEGLHPGNLLQVELASGPKTFTTIAAHSHSYLVIATLSGLFFWMVAFAVFVPRLNWPAWEWF